MHPQPAITPLRSVLAWSLAAVACGFGLALAHGFTEPVMPDAGQIARIALAGGFGLFVLSRLLMLFPQSALSRRLGRWWVDYMLIAAAVAWWLVDREQESFILHLSAAYILLVGAAALFRAGIGSMTEGLRGCGVGGAAVRLGLLVLVLVLVGGTLLALPVCSRTQEQLDLTHPLAWYQMKVHWADCTFAAVSALTGTGLSTLEIGREFNRIGLTVILVLMQVGGLGVLCLGAILGLRFRELLGWQASDDNTSAAGMHRAVVVVCVLTFIIEAAGAVGIYRMWDPAVDLNFGTAQQESPLFGKVAERMGLAGRYNEARVFASVFHSVSAFCDTGLTLTDRGYLPYRQQPAPLLAIMPLMFLGSLGGPVIVEVLRRMTRRNDVGLEGTSKDTLVTLGGSVAVLLLGAGLLLGIESTRQYQQRYPREKTPGRLMVAATQPASNASIEYSSATSERARSERLYGMPMPDRIETALFQAEAARTGGTRLARVDESSLSPVSSLVMMVLMLVGGGAGGAAGGLRIAVVWLLLAGLFRTRSRRNMPAPADPAYGTAIAAAIATFMILLIGLTAAALMYSEAGSPLACAFEATSACCNAGLSMGVTSDLSIIGRVTLMLAMLLGRVIPLAILMRCLTTPTATTHRLMSSPVSATPHVLQPAHITTEDDDAPIPLE